MASLGVAGLGIFLALRPSTTAQTTVLPDATASAGGTIAALGRLEPGDEVYCVYPPSSSGLGNVIKQWLVKEGDRVKPNQVIAVMDTADRLSAAVLQAEAQVNEAENRIQQARTGSKQGEIAAQGSAIAARTDQANARQAEVVRRNAEYENAVLEYQRYEKLQKAGAIAVTLFDQKRLALQTAEAALMEVVKQRDQAVNELEQARQVQSSLAEVRPIDVQQAAAQRDVAIANLQRAKMDLETAAVRSPVVGQVIKIHVKEAEQVSSGVGSSGNSQECRGVAELGKTEQMYAVAEVYETDIGKIRRGQQATITSAAFPEKLTGTVEKVGLKIGKKDVLDTDPAADTDARVVEVRIRLNDSKTVTGMTNLQVKVAIVP